jgi:hypothetical protein
MQLRYWLASGLAGLFFLLGLGGCDSLPRFVPHLNRVARPPVQLEGRQGHLSTMQSKAIVDGLPLPPAGLM